MTESEAREERVLDAVRERRERVNDAIPEELPIQEPKRLYEASRYLLDAGGKRLRPTVTLLVAEALADVEFADADYRSFESVSRSSSSMMSSWISVNDWMTSTLIAARMMSISPSPGGKAR